jgi:two-component system, cell cycle sensor histidine kinase and response regulator CckA
VSPVRERTVLVVDDLETVRRFVKAALEAAGYAVLLAEDGKKALALCKEHGDAIDLVVTDVVMPEFGGLELGEALRETRPHLKILYTSGYLKGGARPGITASIGTFLHKPYTVAELYAKVEKLIAQDEESAVHTL